MMEYLEVAAICNSYLQQLFATQLKVVAARHPPFKAMDLSSAHALLLACKSNAVQQVMLTCYKEEARVFAKTHWPHCNFSPGPPVPPATQCRMRVGFGRCQGAVTELSITQFCVYHQYPCRGDRRVQYLRQLAMCSPNLFGLLISYQWRPYFFQ